MVFFDGTMHKRELKVQNVSLVAAIFRKDSKFSSVLKMQKEA